MDSRYYRDDHDEYDRDRDDRPRGRRGEQARGRGPDYDRRNLSRSYDDRQGMESPYEDRGWGPDRDWDQGRPYHPTGGRYGRTADYVRHGPADRSYGSAERGDWRELYAPHDADMNRRRFADDDYDMPRRDRDRDMRQQRNYGASDYQGQRFERPHSGYRSAGPERGFMERASDEISSWFGDEDAERRRRQDHRGRGPKNYQRSDSRIQEDVSDALTEDGRVDASDITVKVKDCEVTLDGTVDSRMAKRAAEDCADRVSGVQHVQNNLRVKQASGAESSATSGTSTPGGTTSSRT